MANTIYASFIDSSLAEKAAGALLDYGVRPEDISLVRSHAGETTLETMSTGNSATVIGSSTSGQDYTNRALDDPAGIGRSTERYTQTGGGGTWEGSSGDPDADRRAYTGVAPNEVKTSPGSVYGTQHTAEEPIDDYERSAKEGISTTTGADAGAGAVKGLGWGAGVGILAGLASLVVPGFGLVLGGGALATAIGAAVATAGAGAIAGAVTGYLKDQGVEEHVAAHYENTVQSGGALLAVTLPSGQVDEMTVRNVLEKYGAGSINQYASRGYVA